MASGSLSHCDVLVMIVTFGTSAAVRSASSDIGTDTDAAFFGSSSVVVEMVAGKESGSPAYGSDICYLRVSSIASRRTVSAILRKANHPTCRRVRVPYLDLARTQAIRL